MKGNNLLPGFVLIPKVERVADPRIGRLRAGDERVVLDVLLVETDVGLGHFGYFDVGAGQFLAQEFNLLLDGGGRALAATNVHFGDGRGNATAGHGHRQMAGALDWTVHPTGFLYVHLGRVDAAGHGPVNIPEGTLLTVQHLAFQLIALLVHTRLGFRLHEDKLPLPGEHLLQTGQVLRLVVGQLQTRLVLHRPLAQVHGVVRVLRLPAVARPKVGRLLFPII